MYTLYTYIQIQLHTYYTEIVKSLPSSPVKFPMPRVTYKLRFGFIFNKSR